MWLTDAKPNSEYVSDSLSISTVGLDGETSSVDFTGMTDSWVSNGVLPDRLSLSDLRNAALFHDYNKSDGGRVLLRASISSLNEISVTAVPEPGTWAMLLAGLTILGVSARRKRG
jgi:hypothetical protein